jgi:serine carboxypeptidase-like clade I
VTVDDGNGAELFYYFIQSEADPPRDPVLLWLTGGDLCTVFSGLVFEIGKQFWFEAMESFFLQVTIIEK